MSEARKRILNMLAEGKLTPDQAEDLLSGLEADQQTQQHKEQKKALGDEIRGFANQLHKDVIQAMKGINPQTHEIKDHLKKLGGWFQGIVSNVSCDFSKNFSHGMEGAECDFSLEAPPEFSTCRSAIIHNHYGSITVQEGSNFELKVKGKIGKMVLGEETPPVWFAKNGMKAQNGVLEVGLENTMPMNGVFDIHLTMPASLSLKLRTISGEISVSGSFSVEAAQTVSGNLQFSNARFEKAKIETVSGDQKIIGGLVSLESRSSSGDISLQHARIERFTCQILSGDIELKEPVLQENSSIDILTTSGDVAVSSPQGFIGTIKATSRAGTIRSNWAQVSQESPHSIRIEGGSGATLIVETINGDIQLV